MERRKTEYTIGVEAQTEGEIGLAVDDVANHARAVLENHEQVRIELTVTGQDTLGGGVVRFGVEENDSDAVDIDDE